MNMLDIAVTVVGFFGGMFYGIWYAVRKDRV